MKSEQMGMMDMDHERLIKTTCAEVFGVDETHVRLLHRLMGGMSNYTYVVEVGAARYTFRIPGKKAERFVDRTIERHHLQLAEKLNLPNRTVHVDVASGIKIAEYIDGVPLSEHNPLEYLEEAADILKTIHESGLESDYDYAPLERLSVYENHLREFDHDHGDTYWALKEKWLAYRPFLDEFSKTFVHGDAQISNFVIAEDGLYLMDWEFSGNHDPFHDIACFGNNNFDHAVALLPVYLGRAPEAEEYRRLYLWRVFQTLQWHNVARYKAYIGLSEELGIDFDRVAESYLEKARALLAKAEEF